MELVYAGLVNRFINHNNGNYTLEGVYYTQFATKYPAFAKLTVVVSLRSESKDIGESFKLEVMMRDPEARTMLIKPLINEFVVKDHGTDLLRTSHVFEHAISIFLNTSGSYEFEFKLNDEILKTTMLFMYPVADYEKAKKSIS